MRLIELRADANVKGHEPFKVAIVAFERERPSVDTQNRPLMDT